MNDQEPQSEVLQPSRSPAWRRFVLPASFAIALVAGGTIYLQNRAPSVREAAEGQVQAESEVRGALARFLAASTVEARAAAVLNGAQILPAMEAFYAGREPEALSAGEFRVAPAAVPSGPDLLALELMRDRGRSPVLAVFKRSGAGWLLDWEVWRQTSEAQFQNFLIQPEEGEHTLRVRLTSVISPEGQIKVAVEDPFTVGSSMSLDVTRPDLTALYTRDLPGGSSRTATVQLVWLNDGLTGTLQPQLRRHVCWGFSGIDGVAPAEIVNPRAGKYRPFPQTPEGKETSSSELLVQSAVEATLTGNTLSVPPAAKEQEPAQEPVAVAQP